MRKCRKTYIPKCLTLMQLVADLANTKSCKKNFKKLLKPWQMGTHLRELSESYLSYLVTDKVIISHQRANTWIDDHDQRLIL